MKKILILLTILIYPYLLHTQNKVISGSVTEEQTGETIAGVSIYAKEDITAGTSTDANGNYSLTIPQNVTSLIFSSVGYIQKEIAIVELSRIDVQLEPSKVSLDAVVISASRREEKILDAPASISLIPSEQISNTVAISPMANLKGTPGVDIMNTGLLQTNVVVRGFNNIFSGAMLTMVDNRYAAVPSLRVNVGTFIPTDNTDLDRIEVLRGPASALYGPNSSSGVMHMITKSPLARKKDRLSSKISTSK
jgi:iron complex outermembrane receptor protein